MRVNGDHSGRVFDLQRFSIHDGPGIRTTVFLAGCALRCAWCQNPEAWADGRGERRSVDAVIAEVLRDLDYYEASGGGLTVSGGEPLLCLEFLVALLQEARRHGLHTCVQTSGAAPGASFERLLETPLADLFQFDLKHMDPARHRELTGGDLGLIHRNAALLCQRRATVQFRVPVVPGVNDDDENLDRLAHFLLGLEAPALRLVPYHRLYLDKYRLLGLEPGLGGVEPPSAAALSRVGERLASRGIAVEIDG